MKVEKAEKGAAKDNRLWLMILAALGAVIVILVVVIVIIAVNKNAAINPEFGGSEEKLAEAEKIYQKYTNEIKARLNAMSVVGLEQTLDIYDDYIYGVENKGAQALLLIDYYQIVMTYDINKEKKDEVLNGMLEIDRILGTVNSAVFTLNAAIYYEDDILYNRYSEILKERELEKGIDLEMETNG